MANVSWSQIMWRHFTLYIAHLLLTGKAFVTELVAILLTPLSQMNLDLPFPASDAINVNGTIHRVKWRHKIYGYDTFAILWV